MIYRSATDGPMLILKMRGLLRSMNPPQKVKKCFVKHAKTWMCPKNLALALLSENPPKIDLSRLPARELNLDELLSSNRPISDFFTAESALSPCLRVGSTEDWRKFRNNNQCC